MISPEQHERLHRLFVRALDVGPSLRQALLDKECDPRSDERRELESLLCEHDMAIGASEDRLDAKSQVTTPSGHPERIDSFRIVRLIGAGGMGTVYEALQEQPRRTVAIKLMNNSIASDSALRRFEYESEILARLHHPCIAKVYQAGTYDDGIAATPYYAMEYVPAAKPITEFARDNGLSARERLDLFVEICEAVQHGHQRGVIHRDLKPANIVVGVTGQPKIIDFGVARVTDRGGLPPTTLQTTGDRLLGTLQYMSPEQCGGSRDDLDARSDVYALGLVLYELLCNRLPYELAGLSIGRVVEIIVGEPPTKPSTIVPALGDEIDAILLKALEKEGDRRYASAAALADDLKEYLGGRALVHAQPPGQLYHLRHLVRRHKAVAALLTVLFVVVGIFGIWMGVLYARANEHLVQMRVATVAMTKALTELDGATIGESPVRTRRAIDAVMDFAQTGLQGQPASQAAIYEACSLYLSRLAEHDAAIQVLTRALDRRREYFGASSREVIGTLSSLGELLADKGDHSGSLDRYELAYEQYVGAFGHDGGELWILRRQAVALVALGRYDDADTLVRERVMAVDEQGGSLAFDLPVLASIAVHRGNLAEAEGLYRKAIALRDEAQPRDQRLECALAGVLWARGDYLAAEILFRDSLKLLRYVHGERHATVLSTANSLGVCLRDQGKLAEAEQILRRCVETSLSRHGDNHPYFANVKVNLAKTLLAKGMLGEAESLFEDALRIRKATYGDTHADVAEAILGLGWIRLEDGHPRQATELFAKGRRIVGDHLSPDHWRFAEATVCLGVGLAALGEYREAEQRLREGLRGLEETLGPDHPKSIDARRRVAEFDGT